MRRHTQTAADMDGYEQADPESLGEQIGSAVLAFFVAIALVALALEWAT